MELAALVGHEVRVKVTRVPFDDHFNLTLDNGYTEELEPDETRKWFKDHGVTDMEGLESALDYAWNFYEHVIFVERFSLPQLAHPKYAVKL